MDTRKRVGRPPKAPEPGDARISMSLRVSPEIKRRLDQAAAVSGRSLSQEAEMRLEQSFRDQALLSQLLELAFGRQLAGVLVTAGHAMRYASRDVDWFDRWAGGVSGTDWSWTKNPWAFDEMVRAMNDAIAPLRPEGEPIPPSPPMDWDAQTRDRAIREYGMRRAYGALVGIWGAENRNLPADPLSVQARELLGEDLARRIDAWVEREIVLPGLNPNTKQNDRP